MIRIPWKIVAAIAAVWIVAGLAILWSRAARATPESVANFITKNPIANLVPAGREKIIDQVAAQINALDFEQREKLRKERVDRIFFKQMTKDERRRFLDQTLPEGFRQLMISFNKMSPERRKKAVERAMNDLEEGSPEEFGKIDRAEAQKFVSEGMEAFYSEANAEVKLDFAPVIERLQRASQGLR